MSSLAINGRRQSNLSKLRTALRRRGLSERAVQARLHAASRLASRRMGNALNLESQRFSMAGLAGNSASQRAFRARVARASGLGNYSQQNMLRLAALQQQAAALAASYVRPPTGKGGTHEGGARLYVDPTAALKTSYLERQITLPKVCDPKTGTCIQYKAPDKNLVESGFVRGQSMVLPAFYQHPQLGPWGVDPQQAFQYWSQQQAALQTAPYRTPMAVFGSPGVTAFSPGPLPVATATQPAAYDPYSGGFPVAGEAVEKF